MRGLSDTIKALQGGIPAMAGSSEGRLTALAMQGPNPGNLTGWCHVPDAKAPMPLVVVLHGCTQSAAGYDAGSGWSSLAERHGFAVLYPEQQRANNPNLCFNWFVPGDIRRGAGEARSIREMIAAMIERHAIDPTRVFVTGLSAGGAMASVMLATYPEVFAGGTIIAGLPFGAADTVAQALERMRGHGHVDASRYAAQIRQASAHSGAWPAISVWQGSADATVAPANADAILGQWRSLHGVAPEPHETGTVEGADHRVWRDASGRVCLEDYRVAGMGHGTPIATGGPTAAGMPAPYMLDVGVSSTWHSAARWGLLDPEAKGLEREKRDRIGEKVRPAIPKPVLARPRPSTLNDTIMAALKAAGLTR